jgi:hypothetical protein
MSPIGFPSLSSAGALISKIKIIPTMLQTYSAPITRKLQQCKPLATKTTHLLGNVACSLGSFAKQHKIITGGIGTFLACDLAIRLLPKIPCIQRAIMKGIFKFCTRASEDGTATSLALGEFFLNTFILPANDETKENDKSIVNFILRPTFENIDSQQCIRFHTQEGRTLLHRAVKCNRYWVVGYLLEHGHAVNVNRQDQDGNTPLHYAHTLPMWKILIEHDANPVIENNEHNTPMREQINIWQQHFLTMV